jgi:hypothetical protein
MKHNNHVIDYYKHMTKECSWLQRRAISFRSAKYWEKQVGGWYLLYMAESQYSLF